MRQTEKTSRRSTALRIAPCGRMQVRISTQRGNCDVAQPVTVCGCRHTTLLMNTWIATPKPEPQSCTRERATAMRGGAKRSLQAITQSSKNQEHRQVTLNTRETSYPRKTSTMLRSEFVHQGDHMSAARRNEHSIDSKRSRMSANGPQRITAFRIRSQRVRNSIAYRDWNAASGWAERRARDR